MRSIKKIVFVSTLMLSFLFTGIVFGEDKNDQIPILMYHHIVEVYNGESTINIIDLQGFWSHITALKEEGFNFISIEQLRKAEKGEIELPEKPIILTFDDGYESNYKLAYPLIKEYEIKAVMNLVVSTVGETPGVYPHFTWEEAKEMQDSGLVEIGSHTFALHTPEMWKSEEETDDQYYERLFKDFSYSKQLLDSKLEYEASIMCFPYGYYNPIVVKAAYDAGFETFITVDKRINNINGRISLLGRINVDGSYSSDDLIKKIDELYK